MDNEREVDILQRSFFVRAEYKDDPRNLFNEGVKELKRLVPDTVLRLTIIKRFPITYPIVEDFIFLSLSKVLHIIDTASQESGIGVIEGRVIINKPLLWYKDFRKAKLSKDYLQWLLDLFIRHENYESIVIVEERLADEGMLDEQGRFEL